MFVQNYQPSFYIPEMLICTEVQPFYLIFKPIKTVEIERNSSPVYQQGRSL
jgi:hypothetical protein